MFKSLEPLITMAKDQKEELNRLDGLQGDGDLGVTVELIAGALEITVGTAKNLKEFLLSFGESVRKRAPSTLGILLSCALRAAGKSINESDTPTPETLIQIQEAMIQELQKRGEAKLGDRTLLDALIPAYETYRDIIIKGEDSQQALEQAAHAAKAGAESTRNLIPKTGRASWTGKRSLGEVDGGAWLCYNVYQTLSEINKSSIKESREKMSEFNLEGIIATMITPFKENEEVDTDAFIKEIHFLLNAGVHGISVGGSTGEGAVLSDDELKMLCEIAVREVNGQVPIVGGIIRNSTRDAIKAARAVEEAGVKALMITPVHYHVNYPGDRGNYEFYKRISDSVDLPIIIYNVVPSNIITPELLKELSNIPNVYGIKQSGGDIHSLAAMIHDSGSKIKVMSAVDDLLYPTYVIGAKGSIVAPSAIAPELCVRQWEAFLNGDTELALSIHRKLMFIYKAIQGENFPSKIKEAVRLQGRPAGFTRSPLQKPTDQECAVIKEALIESGILVKISSN